MQLATLSDAELLCCGVGICLEECEYGEPRCVSESEKECSEPWSRRFRFGMLVVLDRAFLG